MEVHTARYKLRPTRAQYAALGGVRAHLRDLRNACLQELRDSYRAACREGARHGRERPTADDWIVVRREEIATFMIWQCAKEPQLRAGHFRSEERRIAKLKARIAVGDPKADLSGLTIRPWLPKDVSHFGRPISKSDQYRRLAEIRAADPKGVGAIPVEVLRDQVDIVHRAMDAFFERVKAGCTPGSPRFKSYDRVRSLGCTFGTGISLKGDRLVAPMLWHGAMATHMHRDLPGTPRTIRLTYDGCFWWVTIACEVQAAEPGAHRQAGTAIGVDAGIRRLLTFDDGTFVPNPLFLAEDAPPARRLARALARCRRGSHGRNKAKRALSRAPEPRPPIGAGRTTTGYRGTSSPEPRRSSSRT